MSGRVYVEIRCNAELDPGLPCMTPGPVPENITTLRDARAFLARIGWHQRPHGRDICPQCWAEGLR